MTAVSTRRLVILLRVRLALRRCKGYPARLLKAMK
ncbi:hypothetical protein P3T43_000328 [Paraburkholderia sp. GAS41]|jgi:hypothetical protein